MSDTPTGPRRDQRTCPACGSDDLEPGFLEDAGEASRGFVRWIAGPLERGAFGGAKRMGKQRWVVDALRCRLCGHLSLYANQRT